MALQRTLASKVKNKQPIYKCHKMVQHTSWLPVAKTTCQCKKPHRAHPNFNNWVRKSSKAWKNSWYVKHITQPCYIFKAFLGVERVSSNVFGDMASIQSAIMSARTEKSMINHFFANYDKNGDQLIDEQELKALLADISQALGKNFSEGKISFATNNC